MSTSASEPLIIRRTGEPQIAEWRVRCEAPAPLVLNGASYVGCQLDRGHKGLHKVEIEWTSWSGEPS